MKSSQTILVWLSNQRHKLNRFRAHNSRRGSEKRGGQHVAKTRDGGELRPRDDSLAITPLAPTDIASLIFYQCANMFLERVHDHQAQRSRTYVVISGICNKAFIAAGAVEVGAEISTCPSIVLPLGASQFPKRSFPGIQIIHQASTPVEVSKARRLVALRIFLGGVTSAEAFV